MGKASIRPVFRAYVRTLRREFDGRPLFRDIVFQLIAPVLVGLVLLVRMPDVLADVMASSGGAVTAIGIISSFMYGVSAMVFQIRVDMVDRKGLASDKESRLVDELFADVLWAVVSGFLSVVLMVFAGSSPRPAVWQLVFGSAGVAFMINFTIVSFMCVKRMGSLYSVVADLWSRRREGSSGPS